MPSAKIVNETLDLLWHNYLTLAERVDMDAMDPEILEKHVNRKTPIRPYRIAAWLGRQSFFISAWSLWEHYTNELCNGMPTKVKRAKRNSHVNWVKQSMGANGTAFTDHKWFVSANCLRNLLAHYGGVTVESRAQSLLQRSLYAFPDIEIYKDGYVAIDHSHVAELELKIEHFIDETAQQTAGENASRPTA